MWFWQRYQVPNGRGADWQEYVEPHDPDELLRYARDAWNEYHLPWGIGEIGSKAENGSSGPSFASLPPALFVKWRGHQLGRRRRKP